MRWWVGGIARLLGTTIKKLSISDVQTWDLVKYSKMEVSIVDALTSVTKSLVKETKYNMNIVELVSKTPFQEFVNLEFDLKVNKVC